MEKALVMKATVIITVLTKDSSLSNADAIRACNEINGFRSRVTLINYAVSNKLKTKTKVFFLMPFDIFTC